MTSSRSSVRSRGETARPDGPRIRPTRRLYALLAVIVLANVAVIGARRLEPGTGGSTAPATRARDAAERFLDGYVTAEGRVVRSDQGGDTVSEGQAYGMLLALVSDDRERFDRIWEWTSENLRRPGPLLAWRWSDGEIVGSDPASDADLDAAYALLLASGRFDDPSLEAEALRMAEGIAEQHTVELAGEPVLVAGPWARSGLHFLSPGYLFPTAFEALGKASGEPLWGRLRRSSYDVLEELTRDPPALAPEWALVRADGTVRASGPPSAPDAAPRFSLGAARVPVRSAVDCDARGRGIARDLRGLLGDVVEEGPAISYDLRGRAVELGEHPVPLVAAAAAAHAAGDEASADELLADAEAIDRRVPTYYGAALVALGRGLLAGLLGGCPGG